MRPKIVIAYDATPAAADGLVLGGLLANLVDGDLLVARVLPDTPSTEATERATQAWFHATLHETRRRPPSSWATGRSSSGPCSACRRARHPRRWRRTGRGADRASARPTTAASAACCSATPPRRPAMGRPAPSPSPRAGFRRRAALSPPVIGVAFDGSAESAAALDAA